MKQNHDFHDGQNIPDEILAYVYSSKFNDYLTLIACWEIKLGENHYFLQ